MRTQKKQIEDTYRIQRYKNLKNSHRNISVNSIKLNVCEFTSFDELSLEQYFTFNFIELVLMIK